MVLRNLARVFPDKAPAERRKLTRKIFATAGSAFVEPLAMTGMVPTEAKRHIEFVGKEHLDGLLDEGRGFILLTAHFGVWEIPMMPLQDQLVPMHVLAKNTPNPYMAKEIEAIRRARKQTTILASGGTLKVFRALKRGDRIGLLIDQRVLPSDGILLPFLGEASWTSPMLASISTRTGAAVLPFLCEPTGHDGFRVTFSPPIRPGEKGRDAEYELTRRYVSFMEKGILERPDLWLWLHDRWKRVKRHRWPRTIERLWKLSGLDSADARPIPSRFQPVADLTSTSGFLERGDSYLARGGTEAEREAFCHRVGADLIPRGHSFRLLSLDASGKFEANPTAQDPRALRELDFFDLVALSLPETIEDGAQEAVSDLLAHRLRTSRSLLLVAPASWQAPCWQAPSWKPPVDGNRLSGPPPRCGVLHTFDD